MKDMDVGMDDVAERPTSERRIGDYSQGSYCEAREIPYERLTDI